MNRPVLKVADSYYIAQGRDGELTVYGDSGLQFENRSSTVNATATLQLINEHNISLGLAYLLLAGDVASLVGEEPSFRLRTSKKLEKFLQELCPEIPMVRQNGYVCIQEIRGAAPDAPMLRCLIRDADYATGMLEYNEHSVSYQYKSRNDIYTYRIETPELPEGVAYYDWYYTMWSCLSYVLLNYCQVHTEEHGFCTSASPRRSAEWDGRGVYPTICSKKETIDCAIKDFMQDRWRESVHYYNPGRPVTHELKADTYCYQETKSGLKSFEVRKNDRQFRVGDILLLREWDDKKRTYTGDTCRLKITYILTPKVKGRKFQIPMQDDYVVMAVVPIS